ncbi:GDSL-type esterase/lipase family protein [Haliangium ochraceum]|uniref:Lipolytic protein G-D-S-L family n=1 Tax=Haliangium ochraceum (strain DSM 14365 / JCM 11303 / SMP-2) TaxID=502025 RepID=D0LH28_HALO1|nr:GDSL-type esterase/lipase family protein [Haliangium ochraceum]ACY14750.1 lipolytic protein G-D-S-L family [Haliangium ochraceum DSM 14365]
MPGRTALLLYLLLVHLALAALLLWPGLALRVHQRVGAAEPPQRVFAERLRRHHQRLLANVAPGAVLFLGSSSIQGLDVGAVAERAVNLGIGGDTVPGLSARWPQRVAREARALVVAVGFNDLRDAPAERVAGSFAALLARAPSEVPLVISGPQPLAPALAAERPELSARIAELNRHYQRLCAARARCRYLDTPAVLAACPGGAVHEPDGVHLSARGYACWTSALRRALHALEVTGVRVAGD